MPTLCARGAFVTFVTHAGPAQIPCEVEGPVAPRELICRVPNITGRLWGNFYLFPEGFKGAPEWDKLTPLATAVTPVPAEGFFFNWRTGGLEALGAVAPARSWWDYFGVAFNGYLEVTVGGNYTFSMSADDRGEMYLSGSVLLPDKGATASVVLAAGLHHIEIRMQEYGGSASVRAYWTRPGEVEREYIPASSFMALEQNAPQDVRVAVNGMAAGHGCAGGTCGYTFTAGATPRVGSAGPSGPDLGDSITITGSALEVGSTLHLGDSVTLCAPAGGDLSCPAPMLPGGDYELRIEVPGAGSALVDPQALRFPAPLEVESVSPEEGSVYGGALVTLRGRGFAPLDPGAGGPAAPPLRVTMGNVNSPSATCEVESATWDEVVCVMEGPGAQASYAVRAEVTTRDWMRKDSEGRPDIAATQTVRATGPSYRFRNSATPALESVEPNVLTPYQPAVLELTAASMPPGEVSVDLLAGGDRPLQFDCEVTSTAPLRCIVAQLPAGAFDVRLHVAGTGWSNLLPVEVPLLITALQPVVGSAGGGLPLTIDGNGFLEAAGGDGGDNVTVGGQEGNNVTVGGQPCVLISSTPTRVVCIPGELGEGAHVVEVAALGVGNSTVVEAGVFTADISTTPEVSSVFPARGSTAGGTRVTVAGARLEGGGGEATVSIGGVPCAVEQASASSIVCLTGAPQDKPQGPRAVEVLVPGWGRAVPAGGGGTAAEYEYVDLWSRASTWGGDAAGIPTEGDTVVIPRGTTVLLDVSPPPLVALLIQGRLVVDPAALEIDLHLGYMLVNGGDFIAGSAEEHFPGRLTITLHGHPDSPELPTYGAKCIGLRSGLLQIHGTPRVPSWTRLAATASPGDEEILLEGAVDWRVGDTVVVASSSFFPDEVDEVAVTGVEAAGGGRTRLFLSRPLEFTHLGVVADVEGSPFDMRSEVAVISRDVVIQGDEESTGWRYGVQILSTAFSPGGNVRLQDVEVRRSGQAFRLGRYSIHYHMASSGGLGSYVRSCSIHHTFNRAVAVHATDYVHVADNVAYDVMGHAFFLEDGNERHNVIEGNLGILTRKSHHMLNTDTTPATFWITNPDNVFRNNVAAGSARYGYWVRLLQSPEGPSFTTSMCPKFMPLGEFRGNAAHSNLRYGLRIFPEYYPNSEPCNNNRGTSVPAIFEGFRGYKNGMKGAIATQTTGVIFRDFLIADNGGGPAESAAKVNGKDHGGGLEFTWIIDLRRRTRTPLHEMGGIEGALVVARSLEGQEGTAGRYWNGGRGLRGVITQTAPLGVPVQLSMMQMRDIKLIGWDGPQFRPLEACGKCKSQNPKQNPKP